MGEGTTVGTTVGNVEAIAVADGGTEGVAVRIGDAEAVTATVGEPIGKFDIIGAGALPPPPPPQADNPAEAKANRPSIVFCR